MKKYSVFITILVSAVLLSACSTTRGSYSDRSHYVYPNSNVEPIGQTQAVLEKSSVVLTPQIERREIETLIEKAISKRPDADILIDYKTNTKRSSYGLGIITYNKLRVTVEGTAADMEVGEKDLSSSN
ncbi:PBP1b-binding outer membrane lipoprotein LpoB [Salinibacter ruber]|uniref:hypothetical protein n=1 Tax=Salinibacter ruber TaxID=146919 RepID=UPI0021678214|nr:hypothetical protein [Salinibacter ruber]MCS3748922.1 PBP1b-binding outer membrane lipoprotein LpoB [Salinibacter ruber]